MAFYRCGGGGIPSSLKTDMNAVLNKKFGTSADYPPADWAPTVNLMGPLPEKTIVSSPVADFQDGADDVPTKSLVVTIAPTLSGVSAITENRNGGNFIELYTRSSHNGVDYSINADGSLHRYGTASGNSFNNGNATNYNNCPYKFHAGTYTLSVDGNINNNTFVSLGIFLKSGASFTSQGVTGVGSVTFTVGEDFGAWYYCKLNNGVTVNDDVYIWLYAGSTAHAYEPYTAPTIYTAQLGRTVYGGQADIVNGTGTDENGNDFTFTGQEIPTMLGYNAFWSDSGDTEVTYRADINLALGGQ